MNPKYVVAGRLNREYLLPPFGNPLLDVPGGNLLYTASGLLVWDESVGLVGRVGENYPHQWLRNFEERGLDTRGIRILPGSIDLRDFKAYSETFELSRNNLVTHFAKRELNFPKSLLGYRTPTETLGNEPTTQDLAPTVGDIPKDYLDVSAVHLCPLDLTKQSQLIAAFKAGAVTTITLDPSPSYMHPKYSKDLLLLLNGLTAFMPSQEELRSLFWGKTTDLWEMIEALSVFGCEVIVVKGGSRGQLVYDVPGKKRYEIPAYSSRIADPTGAGDAFCGGFLAGYRKNYDPVQATIYGNISASLKLEGSGAFYPLDVMPGLAQARLEVIKEMVRKV